MAEQPRGMQSYFNSAVDEAKVAAVARPCRIFALHIINPNLTDVFLQIFDAASGDVTVGTTTPKCSLLIPGGAGASNQGAFQQSFSDMPIQVDTALTIAITAEATTNGAIISDCQVNIGYRG